MNIRNAEIWINDIQGISPGLERVLLSDNQGNQISISTHDLFRAVACVERDAESRGLSRDQLLELLV